MARLYARAPKGERIYAPIPFKRGENVTVLGALSLQGIIASMSIEGYADGLIFLTYIKQIVVPQLREGNVVLLDNLSIHKVAGVKESIESVGARLLYLPPYSPDLSPIEEGWSKFKAKVRGKAARIPKKLHSAISEGLSSITPQDARGFFSHAGYCIPPN
jgi:transposase